MLATIRGTGNTESLQEAMRAANSEQLKSLTIK